jgi:hypothetical protein
VRDKALRDARRAARAQHEQDLRNEGLNPVHIEELVEQFVNAVARPLFTFRMSMNNDKPGATQQYINASLDMDATIMDYVRRREELKH